MQEENMCQVQIEWEPVWPESTMTRYAVKTTPGVIEVDRFSQCSGEIKSTVWLLPDGRYFLCDDWWTDFQRMAHQVEPRIVMMTPGARTEVRTQSSVRLKDLSDEALVRKLDEARTMQCWGRHVEKIVRQEIERRIRMDTENDEKLAQEAG